jgi:hypothetical protein
MAPGQAESWRDIQLKETDPMSTVHFIIGLFCLVDYVMMDMSKHIQASLYGKFA